MPGSPKTCRNRHFLALRKLKDVSFGI